MPNKACRRAAAINSTCSFGRMGGRDGPFRSIQLLLTLSVWVFAEVAFSVISSGDVSGVLSAARPRHAR
jgi:hypothetical protein